MWNIHIVSVYLMNIKAPQKMQTILIFVLHCIAVQFTMHYKHTMFSSSKLHAFIYILCI